jgi:L-fuconolactonase
MRIDAHQHFWKFNPIRDSWITDDMSVIRRDFLPADLKPILAANGFDGCIVVQSDQTEEENDFQLKNAETHEFVKGVVGWVDLQADNIEERLEYYSQFSKLKGFRHILQGEKQRDLMLKPQFLNGVGRLSAYNFTYDILIYPDQLQFIPTFVAAFPNQKFVLDHIAKPNIKRGEIENWKTSIQAIAKYENVYCKVSGMVTEANWSNWQTEDFTPYLDVVVEAFGINRIMYGSDWPVCELAGGYERSLSIVQQYFSLYSTAKQNQFFGENASVFYNI